MAKLRIIRARKGNYELPYPFDGDIPDKDKIVFKMKYLTYKEREKLATFDFLYKEPKLDDKGKPIVEEDRYMVTKHNVLKEGTAKIESAVTGWKNVQDEHGKPIPFSIDELLDLEFVEFTTDDGEVKKYNVRIDLLKHIEEVNDLSIARAGE